MKRIVTLLCIVAVCCFFRMFFADAGRTEMDELMWENVEALSEDENSNYACYGEGNVDCHGIKVKVMFDNLR